MDDRRVTVEVTEVLEQVAGVEPKVDAGLDQVERPRQGELREPPRGGERGPAVAGGRRILASAQGDGQLAAVGGDRLLSLERLRLLSRRQLSRIHGSLDLRRRRRRRLVGAPAACHEQDGYGRGGPAADAAGAGHALRLASRALEAAALTGLILATSAFGHSGSRIEIPPSDLSAAAIALEFGRYGAEHIVFGHDHLLFLAGLTLLSASVRDIVAIVALFAVAYSTTLIGGTLLGVAVPAGLIDSLIAASVGYVGAQIAFGCPGGRLGRDPRGPALVFGLAHGLGLSSLLQELQLPNDDLLPTAIGFNLGVELGQLVVIGVMLGGLALARAVPFPARQWIPAGCALIGASVALLVLVHWQPPIAVAHVAPPPPPPLAPPPEVSPIRADDEARYRSHATVIDPEVPGLEARILGRQDQLELTWTGREPLVVYGAEGEPMLRMSAAGVEINELSPSAYLSADRYAEVSVPSDVNPDAPPQWRLLDSAGPFAWFEHRAHWMNAERPDAVGDGGLDWIADPEAARDRVEVADGALGSGIVVLVALAGGALAGRRLRDRLDPADG